MKTRLPDIKMERTKTQIKHPINIFIVHVYLQVTFNSKK